MGDNWNSSQHNINAGNKNKKGLLPFLTYCKLKTVQSTGTMSSCSVQNDLRSSSGLPPIYSGYECLPFFLHLLAIVE